MNMILYWTYDEHYLILSNKCFIIKKISYDQERGKKVEGNLIKKFNLQVFADPETAPAEHKTKASELAEAFGAAAAEHTKSVLEAQNKELSELIESLKSMIKDQKTSKYEGVYKHPSATLDQAGVEHNEPGIKMARYFKAKYVSKREGVSMLDATKQLYSHDKAYVESFEKAISVSGDGGNLVPEAYASEIIPLLYAKTAVIELGARVIPMPSGNLNFPKCTSGTDAEYIGENKSKNAANPKYTNIKLSAKKLRAKVVVSNDLLRSSSYDADVFIRDEIVRQMRLKMDYTAMLAVGSNYTPKGIKNTSGVHKVTVGAVPDVSNVTEPVAAVEGSNADMESGGWIFNSTFKWLLYNITDGNGNLIYRDELDRGMFLGYPFVMSNQIPVSDVAGNPTDVFFGDFYEWLIGEQLSLELKMFDQASYKDENGDTQSAADNDQTVFAALAVHDMAATHGEVFACYTYNTTE